MSKNSRKQGFTIIEVVLVLAIAGLIFLMVFVALPALQRSQKDTQRRQDYADLASTVTSYMTNNNGRLPSGTLNAADYVNATGQGPTGTAYTVKACPFSGTGKCTLSEVKKITDNKEGTVLVVTGAKCGDNGQPVSTPSTKSFAIYGPLESGNGTYCQSNN